MQLAAAHQRAYEMLDEHLPHSDWQVTFDRARHRAGKTDYNRGLIVLSIPYVLTYSEFQLEQLMLHEIAHVLAGPGKDHGKEWKTHAKGIGYEGGATVDGLKDGGANWWRPWAGTLAVCIGITTASAMFGGMAIGIWLSVAAVSLWRRWGPIPEMYKPLKQR